MSLREHTQKPALIIVHSDGRNRKRMVNLAKLTFYTVSAHSVNTVYMPRLCTAMDIIECTQSDGRHNCEGCLIVMLVSGGG